MSTHNKSRFLAVLKLQQLFLALLKWLQNVFPPQNRPFIRYLIFIALGAWVVNGLWPAHVNVPRWFGAMTSKISTPNFITAHLPTITGYWSIELSSFFFFWLITRPVELRQYRWLRIGVSVTLVYLLLSRIGKPLDLEYAGRAENIYTFFHFVVPAAVLAGIWTPALSSYIAGAMTVSLDPPGDHDPEPILKPAYDAARAGELRQAVKLLRPTLRADFYHYEALVLAASLHRQLNRPWRTRIALLRALQKPELLEAQRARLHEMMEHVDEAAHTCWQIPGLAESDLRGHGNWFAERELAQALCA